MNNAVRIGHGRRHSEKLLLSRRCRREEPCLKDKKLKSNEVGYDNRKDLEVALPNEGEKFVVPPALPSIEDIKLNGTENEQSKYAYSLVLATAAAAVVSLTSASRFCGKSKEDMAATKIQTAFRGHLARRALRALKGLVRLKRLIHGKSVKRQAASTLHCMQTFTTLQSQVHERRTKMSEENQALQWQLPQKRVKELEKLQVAVKSLYFPFLKCRLWCKKKVLMISILLIISYSSKSSMIYRFAKTICDFPSTHKAETDDG